MTETITIAGLDPLLFGDGRPFGSEPGALSARTLPLPLPSTAAGAVRTAIARSAGWTDYSDAIRDRLLQVAVRGPLLTLNGELVFAKPADAVIVKAGDKDRQIAPARPRKGEPNADLPDGMLLTHAVGEPTKEKADRNWRSGDMVPWLAKPPEGSMPAPECPSPPIERRTHVGIKQETQAAKDKMLYQTEGVCLNAGFAKTDTQTVRAEFGLCAGVTLQEGMTLPEGVISLGGERRLAVVQRSAKQLFDCPADIRHSLDGAKRIRLILATPALFSGGWRPGWSERAGVKLKLVAACVGRREPVSGWNPFKGGSPKPVRWMAPAGSVYFFEAEGPTEKLVDLWLQPVSDNEQDCRDGFGLALWGTWDHSEVNP
jgi:CRISPR-associated protein Cmr3